MPFLHIIFAILVAATWGGNFVSAKFGMLHFPPFFLTMLRFLLVAPMLLPFVPRPNRAQLKQIAWLALVLGVMHFAFLFASLYVGLDIASCTIIVQLGVPFSCLLGAILHRDVLGPWRIVGMVIAFLGMIVVTGNPNILSHPAGFLLALAGAFCWGISNILIKSIKGVANFQLLGWMALCAAPQLLLVSLVLEHDQWHLLLTTPPFVIASLAYTVFISTFVGYGLWNYLLQKYPVSQITPYALLTPVFAIAFGQLFFTESLSWQTLLGGVITIGGVAIIVIRRPKVMEIGEQI